ncbi:MAG: hypothetical protein J5917_07225 [Bacteroidales bacterium]|nr:hypothetical protein [Bacteroidales bacterium]
MILVRKCLHTGFFALLGLLFLAGCVRDPGSCEVAERVTEGPVNVSLTLALKAFGSDGSITKADFVDVDDSLHYPHEKVLKDAGIFLYNATAAFEVNPLTSKYQFNPALATRIGPVEPVHTESLEKGAKLRVDFELDDPYTSLAVLVLGNYHISYSSTAANMQAAVAALSQSTEAVVLPDQSTLISDGIPMHGWMVFGSLEGLDAGAGDAQKENRQLKYYKGMSTPLTKYGFRNAEELAAYASATTGRGTVRLTDCVPMRYALSRLQLRYVPDTDGIAADSVEVLSVQLNVHRDKFLKLPANLLGGEEVTPFDAVTDVGNFSTAALDFTKVNVSTKSTAWVAYVPEVDSAAVKTAVAAAEIDEPALEVAVKVTPRYGSAGETVTFTYSGDRVTMDDGVNPAVSYENPGWTSWLNFRTIYARKDKDNNDIPVGTMYNLVRHYSYEWIATGVDR